MKKDFFNWLNKLNEREKIDITITALNFGLYETEKGYCIYLIGSNNYDESDDDWATEISYEPKEYKGLNIAIDKNKYDWLSFQNLAVKIIESYINSDNYKNSIFSKIEIMTAGFDNGDLIRVK
ncbi:hypothetical protein A9P82_00400 [Arachidicoccus ginsenosidimutans]|nr:hypothetical protein A9P82_00400 [Arachidicoccus sp. BS20]